jgi:hypothetical protein
LDFKKLVAAIVEEYFISEDLGEMIRSHAIHVHGTS